MKQQNNHTHRPRHWAVCAVLMAVLATALSASPLTAEEPYRLWTSEDGNYQVMAKLTDYDKKIDLLTLTKQDGDSLLVAIDKISASDQRYLRSFQSSRSQRVLADPLPQNEATPTKKTKQRNKKAKQPNFKTLYGIDWIPDMKTALSHATGKPTTNDDRPVMWFRVLGDLKGLM